MMVQKNKDEINELWLEQRLLRLKKDLVKLRDSLSQDIEDLEEVSD